MPTLALNFSRPGGQVIAQYYNFLRLGREGYTKIHSACCRTARYLADEIAALGPFEMLYGGDPTEGIPALCWTIGKDQNPGYSLYDVTDRLRMRGWQVPAYALPARMEETVVQRILVRRGVSLDLASLLLADFKAAIEHLTKRPLTGTPDACLGTGFHH